MHLGGGPASILGSIPVSARAEIDESLHISEWLFRGLTLG
jgi:hypothetical protein